MKGNRIGRKPGREDLPRREVIWARVWGESREENIQERGEGACRGAG